MIRPFKDRSFTQGQRVEVYRNLNKGGFSVRDKKSKLVIAHGDGIMLRDCDFIVQEGSRQRAIAAKQRNVHAWIEGDLDLESRFTGEVLRQVYYEPFVEGYFTDGLEKIKKADQAMALGSCVWTKWGDE